MATNKNVIVLVPNGRRQNVKVTANTTILQVLEEVCQKHGYNVEDYDVKHFHKVLDPNVMLRFTGLSNNAQLEMIPCTKMRLNSAVTIGVQLENGEKLTGDFMPNTTLAEVLQFVGIDQDLDRILLIYMHRKICGIDALKNTTLKSLGLTNGKAVLRLMYQNPQNMDVTTLTESKSLKNTEYSCVDNKTILDKVVSSTISLPMEAKASDKLEAYSHSIESQTEVIPKMDEKHKAFKVEESKSVKTQKEDTCEISSQTAYKHETKCLSEIKFLGERNALIFNQAELQPISREELPDDFYDLTVDDAKILIRCAKRYRKELEEAPLLTNAQRHLNQEKRTLNQLNKYRYTIIRIHFSDQFVLQGLFKPLETIQAIKNFVKDYLIDPNSDFVIFTTPPKRVLNSGTSLIDENLVPCANVYYSGPSSLKLDIKQQVTDPKKVEIQVAQIRMSMGNQEDQIIRNNIQTNNTTSGEINI